MTNNIRSIKINKLVFNYNTIYNSDIINKFIDKIVSQFQYIEEFFNVEYSSLQLTLYSKPEFNEFVANATSLYGNKDNIHD